MSVKVLGNRAYSLPGQARLCPMADTSSLISCDNKNAVHEDFPVSLLLFGKVGQSGRLRFNTPRSFDENTLQCFLPAKQRFDISLI